MLTPIFTGSFKKDRRLMAKRGRDMDKLTDVMKLLVNEQPLLPKHCNHPLQGNYKGKWVPRAHNIFCVKRKIHNGTLSP